MVAAAKDTLHQRYIENLGLVWVLLGGHMVGLALGGEDNAWISTVYLTLSVVVLIQGTNSRLPTWRAAGLTESSRRVVAGGLDVMVLLAALGILALFRPSSSTGLVGYLVPPWFLDGLVRTTPAGEVVFAFGCFLAGFQLTRLVSWREPSVECAYPWWSQLVLLASTPAIYLGLASVLRDALAAPVALVLAVVAAKLADSLIDRRAGRNGGVELLGGNRVQWWRGVFPVLRPLVAGGIGAAGLWWLNADRQLGAAQSAQVAGIAVVLATIVCVVLGSYGQMRWHSVSIAAGRSQSRSGVRIMLGLLVTVLVVAGCFASAAAVLGVMTVELAVWLVCVPFVAMALVALWWLALGDQPVAGTVTALAGLWISSGLLLVLAFVGLEPGGALVTITVVVVAVTVAVGVAFPQVVTRISVRPSPADVKTEQWSAR